MCGVQDTSPAGRPWSSVDSICSLSVSLLFISSVHLLPAASGVKPQLSMAMIATHAAEDAELKDTSVHAADSKTTKINQDTTEFRRFLGPKGDVIFTAQRFKTLIPLPPETGGLGFHHFSPIIRRSRCSTTWGWAPRGLCI